MKYGLIINYSTKISLKKQEAGRWITVLSTNITDMPCSLMPGVPDRINLYW